MSQLARRIPVRVVRLVAWAVSLGLVTTGITAAGPNAPSALASGKRVAITDALKIKKPPRPTPTPTTTSSLPTATPTPSPTPTPTTTTSSPTPTGTTAPPLTAWGVAGGYGGVSLTDLQDHNAKVGMVEMTWARAEPTEGVLDTAYLDGIRRQVEAVRAAGLSVVLNYGLHHAPTWLLTKPNARFVNQSGQAYSGSDEANLIFATELRPYAEAYTAKVFATLGTDFLAVRVGGGHWGELQYPAVVDSSTGRIRNDYWAFDGAAARSNPVPGWRPGASSPNGEAGRFLAWYLNRLAEYQNWQIASLRRAGYSGTIGVLYASWGMRSGDFDKAVSTNLSGTSSPEINGEVQRGYDHARLAAALTDRNVALWGTWAEKVGTLSWLSSLAKPRGLGLMGENSGSDTADKMAATKVEATTYGASLIMWIRASELYCSCGYATIDDFSRVAAT